MRATEALLLAAYDESAVLTTATNLLGEHFGYGMRYLMLYDRASNELHMVHAAGPASERSEVRTFRTTLGRGLTGICAETKAIVNVPNVARDPRYISVVPECQSEICVPILVRGDLLGVLVVESSERNAFSAKDEELLTAISQVLALALIHARADRRRRSDIAELQAVNEVARRATSLDLDDTLRAAVEEFQRVTTSDSTAVYLWHEAEHLLRLGEVTFDPRHYPADYPERLRAQPLRLGEGMVGWSAEHREALAVDDVAKDPRPQPVRGIPLESKSAIVVPLLVEDRLLGVIRAVKMGIGTYSAEHFRFAQTVAHQVALALAAVRAHQQVQRAAITDGLTGLYNARYFSSRIAEEVQRAQRYQQECSLLVVDSDALKQVNDRYGHEAGDQVVVDIARAIRQHVRASDLVARYGGDEFVILQPQAGTDAARVTGERIREGAFSRVGPEGITASVSVGIATFPTSAGDAVDLFRKADAALYTAKRQGKNAVVVAGPLAK